MCPTCNDALTQQGTRFVCEPCGGVLVVAGELEAMLRELAPEDPRSLEQRLLAMTGAQRTCPRCEVAMQRWLFATVTIERCVEHGVWFDKEGLVHALEWIDATYPVPANRTSLWLWLVQATGQGAS
jgi:Zn-finger nucleic acid-binding protein